MVIPYTYDDIEGEFDDDVAEIQAAPDSAILAAATPPIFYRAAFRPSATATR